MYSGPGDIVGCYMASRRSRPGNHCKSRVSLLSKVSSQVHIISWHDLLRVMRVYPEIRKRIMEQMVLSFELDSADMVSDLRVSEQGSQCCSSAQVALSLGFIFTPLTLHSPCRIHTRF